MSDDYDPRRTCGKPCDCPSYRAHLLSIGVSAAATPSRDRSKETVEIAAREKQLDKDMPAYKRLRDEGLQPRHLDGSANLEARAKDRLEIEGGSVIADGHLKVVKEIKEIQKETAGTK